MIDDLLVGTGDASAVRVAVAEPRAKSVRRHWKIALWVVERPADCDGVVRPSWRAQRGGDLGSGDRLVTGMAPVTGAGWVTDALGQRLVNQVP